MLILGSCIEKIGKLKKKLSKEFTIKNFGAAKQIFEMSITGDKVNGILKLSQEEYVKNVLSRFNIDGVKLVGTLLTSHFKLSKSSHPQQSRSKPTWPICLMHLLLVALCIS